MKKIKGNFTMIENGNEKFVHELPTIEVKKTNCTQLSNVYIKLPFFKTLKYLFTKGFLEFELQLNLTIYEEADTTSNTDKPISNSSTTKPKFTKRKLRGADDKNSTIQ